MRAQRRPASKSYRTPLCTSEAENRATRNHHVMVQAQRPVWEATMPQPRKYAGRAAQQAAYRKRQAREREALLASKGLPLLPAISTIPGHARWNAMLVYAQTLLTDAADEMQEYHDDRSA